MKIGFYGIYSQASSKDKYSLDALNFLSQKSSITGSIAINSGSYYLYMHPIDSDTFLFTKTNDSNLIQKINKSNSSVEEIIKSLATDELLGFASYVYIHGDIMGFARSMYGPTTSDFAFFLKELQIPLNAGANISVEPLMRATTKADVLKMHFIGKTTVKVEATTGLSAGILTLLGAKDIEEELLDSIEIVIKPKPRRNIKNLTKDIVSNPAKQFSDIGMRAKDEAADIMTDHYLSEKGHLSAKIERSTNSDVADEIKFTFLRMKQNLNDTFIKQIGNLI